MNEFAPIIQISYNRPNVLRETLSNLSCCYGVQNHDIFAFVDGPRSDSDVEKVTENISVLEDFKSSYLPRLTIIKRQFNLGGIQNMCQSISEILERYGKAIIIEDDILVARTFLQYANAGLKFYEKDKRIWAINGYLRSNMKIDSQYPYDIFLAPRHSAWGWATWKDRWDAVDFKLRDFEDFISNNHNQELFNICGCDMLPMLKAQFAGKLNAWDVQCTYHMVKNNLYVIRPRKSMTKNNGFGTNCEHCSQYVPEFAKQKYYNLLPGFIKDIQTDSGILSRFAGLQNQPCLIMRIMRRMVRAIRKKYGMVNRHPKDEQ